MWGMSYIQVEEAGSMATPCNTLGHFYEEHECIYCAARFCATENGGHSFEKEYDYSPGSSPRYCYFCKSNIVSLMKG